jgi:RNA-directed DNA polymerase
MSEVPNQGVLLPCSPAESVQRCAQHLRVTQTLHQLAAWVNPRLQGWINYYGHIYRSALLPILRCLDAYLARWARRKYKRLSNSRDRAYRFLRRVHCQEPALFVHWRLGVRP